jgi:hypothetical protein
MFGEQAKQAAPLVLGGIASRWAPDLNRDVMLLLGVLCGLGQAADILPAPVDASAYWLAGTSTNLYPKAWAEVAPGYLFYPPPVAQISTLLQPIGWGAFITVLTTGIFASIWYCAGRWSLPLLAIGLTWLVWGVGQTEVNVFLGYALLGNLQWILAALAVVAIRHPALWAIQLVTKVTTAVGWGWQVFRGEWRAAAIGAAACAGVGAVSLVLARQMWFDFMAFALRNGSMADPPIAMFPVPFGVRLASALPLLAWGARTNRAWTVPVAVGWSLPALYGLGFLPFWVAGWRLRGSRSPTRVEASGSRA